MLLYRGEIPEAGDFESDPISQGLAYPTAYGYCAVGKVVQAGAAIDRSWLGRLVFAFQPHASHFVASPSALLELPPGLAPEEGVFLASAETAVNIVQDAAPILGERTLVLGQGVVGLLVTSLLHDFPLESLVTADRYARRRKASSALGVSRVLDPGDPDFSSQALGHAAAERRGFDVSVELTGSPAALDAAIELTAFSGRVVVGSWFGTKSAPLKLGGRYHRSRIRVVASQVSTIAPELSGRWDKARRFATAWKALERIRPSKWITHRLPFERAAEAYRTLDRSPEEVIQVVFKYS
jgi:2-desacetyl-2-hydroxyethyl bacteriochlorophyllide A dehydrogenase